MELTPEEIRMLREIAKLGGTQDHVVVSSGDLAKRLGSSQQTASRRILDLLRKGAITRRMGARKQFLRVAPPGAQTLRAEYGEYQRIFAPHAEGIAFRGVVVAGLGEGQYYMSRKGYREMFQKLLGFDPHPGTLNLRLPEEEMQRLQALDSLPGLEVPEFTDEGRSFGAVRCFPATIEGVDCAVVAPVRSHHRDILEVISPFRLRTRLGLKDGDEVKVALRAP